MSSRPDDDKDKPNMIFRLSPKDNHFEDPEQKTCDARLEIFGGTFRHDERCRLRLYYEFDYVALGGRRVRKGKRKLRKPYKYCVIKIEIINWRMEDVITVETPEEDIDAHPPNRFNIHFVLSQIPGKRLNKHPYVQLYKRMDNGPYRPIKIDKERPIDIMRSGKKPLRLKKFYTQITGQRDDPTVIVLPREHFTKNPKPFVEPYYREKITYAIRLATKCRDKDQTLLFHSANAFLVKPVDEGPSQTSLTFNE